MARPPVSRGELPILQFVADRHPVTVGQAAEHFARTAGLARTTVLTVMDRLRRKGYLGRKKVEGVYQYSPRVPQEALLRTLVREFVSGPLGGSLTPFMAYLTGEADLSDEQVAELKQIVRDLDARRKEGRS